MVRADAQMRWTVRASCVVGAVMVMVVGCTSDRRADSDQQARPTSQPSTVSVSVAAPGQGATAPPGSGAGGKSPYADFGFTARDVANVAILFDRKTGECMEAAGFEWPYEDPAVIIAESRARDSTTNLPLDPEVQADGYPPPPTGEKSNGAGVNLDDYINKLPDVERTAFNAELNGDGSEPPVTYDIYMDGSKGAMAETAGGGCWAQAVVEMFGSFGAWYEYEAGEYNRQSAALEKAKTVPEVQTALASWRTCMSGHGFDFEEWGQARGEANVSPSNADSIYRADVACTSSSGLHSAVVAAYNAELNAMAEQYGSGLAERREQVRDAVKNASQD